MSLTETATFSDSASIFLFIRIQAWAQTASLQYFSPSSSTPTMDAIRCFHSSRCRLTHPASRCSFGSNAKRANLSRSLWSRSSSLPVRDRRSLHNLPATSHVAKWIMFSLAKLQHLHGSPVVMLRTIRVRCSMFLKCEAQSLGVRSLVLYRSPTSFGRAPILFSHASQHAGSMCVAQLNTLVSVRTLDLSSGSSAPCSRHSAGSGKKDSAIPATFPRHLATSLISINRRVPCLSQVLC